MRNRGLILGLLAALFVLVGAAAAFAASDGDDEGPEAIVGSVAVPEGSEGEDKLRGLAEIDQAEAESSALRAFPGIVEAVELEDENGFAVYEVEVEGEDGETREVIVDAGNGEVLGQEDE